MINNLQLDIRKEDYGYLLFEKLNLTLKNLLELNILSEQIFREDKDEKKHNTPKFKIHLNIRDNTLISIIHMIVNYFNSNDYIKTYQGYL